MSTEIIFIPLAAAGLFWWWRAVQDIAPEQAEVVESGQFRIADGIFASLFAALFLMHIIGSDGEPQELTAEMMMSAIVLNLVLAGFVVAFLHLRQLDVVSLFGLNRFSWRGELAPAVFGVITIFPVVMVAAWLSRLALPIEDRPDATILFLRSEPGVGAWFIAGSLIVLIAPLVEELIFRGLLYGVARRFAGRWAALVATSVLFSAIHLNPATMVALFVLSVAMTFAYEKTGSLWTPITMHMIFNGTQFAILLLFPQWMS